MTTPLSTCAISSNVNMFMWYYSLLVIFIIVSSSFAQNDNCRHGYYGNNCEVNCPDQCRPLLTYPCNKQSGKCSEGCNEGFYGDQCKKTCTCPSGVCYQENGECYGTGTTPATTTQNTTTSVICPTTVHTTLSEGVGAGWRTIAIFLIILFIVSAGGIVVALLRLRKYGYFKKGDEEKGEEEVSMMHRLSPIEEDTATTSNVQSEKPISLDEVASVNPSVHKPSQEILERNEKIRKLEEENHRIKARCAEKDRTISSYEKREEEIQRLSGLPPNSTNHLMVYTKSDHPKWLQCPHLKFDSETVNLAAAGFGENMWLWNVPDHRFPENNRKRFQTFRGTTCTEPLVKTGFYQYFEAIFDIGIRQPVEEGEVVMQLGFCQEKDRDLTPFIESKKNCFVVQAVSCKEHNKICLVSILEGKIEHLQELMNNVRDSKHWVLIGIRLNKEGNKIALYDCRQLKCLQNTNIDIGKNIWPMFGVCAENKASVIVTLIAGQDIEMSGRKKETIKTRTM